MRGAWILLYGLYMVQHEHGTDVYGGVALVGRCGEGCAVYALAFKRPLLKKRERTQPGRARQREQETP
jgi:hypothetical protein